MDRFALPSAELDVLRRRAATAGSIRDFFGRRGFLEVDTPVLSRDTVVDRHLDPIPVAMPDSGELDCQTTSMWLQTSPEFAMKRLIAAGAQAIFQFAHAFRIGERGDFHNPEFTLLEWYRVGDNQQQAINTLGELACMLFDHADVEALNYRDAFLRFAQIDPFDATDDDLRHRVSEQGDVAGLDSADRDTLLNLLIAESVEPRLGLSKPTILFDYPASQAALARTQFRAYGEVAERFELFVQGVELANGYHELTDTDELQARNRRVNRQRVADGKNALPIDSRLLDAMRSGLPPCAGVALGLDRVIMLQTGATSIDQVIPFPIERA